MLNNEISTERLIIRQLEVSDIRFFCIYLKNNLPIGFLDISPKQEICYTLEIQGKGYGPEALKAVLEKAELDLEKCYLTIDKFNYPSQRCAEKCGFKKISSEGMEEIWKLR